MKKSLIAAVSCFVVGVVGLTCTLPMAAQEGVSLYKRCGQQPGRKFAKAGPAAGDYLPSGHPSH